MDGGTRAGRLFVTCEYVCMWVYADGEVLLLSSNLLVVPPWLLHSHLAQRAKTWPWCLGLCPRGLVQAVDWVKTCEIVDLGTHNPVELALRRTVSDA